MHLNDCIKLYKNTVVGCFSLLASSSVLSLNNNGDSFLHVLPVINPPSYGIIRMYVT